MDAHAQTAQPSPLPVASRPAEARPAPPAYTPPRIVSYTDAEILAALGPAQTGGYAGGSGSSSWL